MSRSLTSQLRELHDAKQEGLITEQEFATTKARMIAAFTGGGGGGGGVRSPRPSVARAMEVEDPNQPVVVALAVPAASAPPAAAAEAEECAICLEPFKDPVLLPCTHTYCRACLQGMRQDACPTCRAPLPAEFAQHAAELVIDDARKQLEAERKMIIEAMGGAVKGCPACGNLIEKVDGDHQVMCGCEAKPAGGWQSPPTSLRPTHVF